MTYKQFSKQKKNVELIKDHEELNSVYKRTIFRQEFKKKKNRNLNDAKFVTRRPLYSSWSRQLSYLSIWLDLIVKGGINFNQKCILSFVLIALRHARVFSMQKTRLWLLSRSVTKDNCFYKPQSSPLQKVTNNSLYACARRCTASPKVVQGYVK